MPFDYIGKIIWIEEKSAFGFEVLEIQKPLQLSYFLGEKFTFSEFDNVKKDFLNHIKIIS